MLMYMNKQHHQTRTRTYMSAHTRMDRKSTHTHTHIRERARTYNRSLFYLVTHTHTHYDNNADVYTDIDTYMSNPMFPAGQELGALGGCGHAALAYTAFSGDAYDHFFSKAGIIRLPGFSDSDRPLVSAPLGLYAAGLTARRTTCSFILPCLLP